MQAQTSPEPMRFHGPGWTLDLSERDEDGAVVMAGEIYQVWAPQPDIIRDPEFPGMWSTDRLGWHEDAKQPREHWAASWQSGDGEAGDFIKGKAAADVLYIFPDRIAKRFRDVLLADHLSLSEGSPNTFLPTRQRVDGDLHRYPNELTLESVLHEIQTRIGDGFEPVEAFLTVAEGVENWRAQEDDDG